jgi:hypothetical protein
MFNILSKNSAWSVKTTLCSLKGKIWPLARPRQKESFEGSIDILQEDVLVCLLGAAIKGGFPS